MNDYPIVTLSVTIFERRVKYMTKERKGRDYN